MILGWWLLKSTVKSHPRPQGVKPHLFWPRTLSATRAPPMGMRADTGEVTARICLLCFYPQPVSQPLLACQGWEPVKCCHGLQSLLGQSAGISSSRKRLHTSLQKTSKGFLAPPRSVTRLTERLECTHPELASMSLVSDLPQPLAEMYKTQINTFRNCSDFQSTSKNPICQGPVFSAFRPGCNRRNQTALGDPVRP